MPMVYSSQLEQFEIISDPAGQLFSDARISGPVSRGLREILSAESLEKDPGDVSSPTERFLVITISGSSSIIFSLSTCHD